ncbi:Sodium/proton antiporter nhaA [Suttonella indologenes]|uniref:Na(+)/H(+) antiporter NhaA n=1 Tax=Suttonella indologenes TaxID=13276 RepID=A0A380MY14_9GAMM|nr:Sodium/proton antiporter nhaA [Suttonella indologenes]
MKPFGRKRYIAEHANSWELLFGRILTPFEKIVNSSIGSGMLLIVLTVIAMLLANSPLYGLYDKLLHQHLVIAIGDMRIDMTLHHWINDALMCIFFYLVGLEIKREMLVGELSSFRQAILPIMAAMGGMVVPALVYFAFNPSGPNASGWGIPMATDIAFAIAILLLLGDRVPAGLMTILMALAIVDDLGAVAVIALFYTEAINYTALISAFICFAVLMVFNRAGVRAIWAYLVVATAMWLCMLFSGVHATIAGVLGALATPVHSLYRPAEFSREARKLLDRFDIYRENEKSFMVSDRLNAVLYTLESGINRAQTPLQRLEHTLHKPVYFLVIPLFVLFNAGVHLDFGTLHLLPQSSVVQGVVLGLSVGKLIGIFAAVWLCVKLNLAVLPKGVNFGHIIGVGLLAGIGFTMSIFISELAFKNDPLHLSEAKIAILFASICAGVLGYCWLRFFTSKETH